MVWEARHIVWGNREEDCPGLLGAWGSFKEEGQNPWGRASNHVSDGASKGPWLVLSTLDLSQNAKQQMIDTPKMREGWGMALLTKSRWFILGMKLIDKAIRKQC